MYMESSKTEQLLITGIKELNLSVPVNAISKLISFINLIKKWNKIYNLTAAKSDEDIVINHILDSLSIVPFILKKEILDVGSGAGFPGIPLAIFLPEFNFILLDCLNKRTRFLNQAVIELQIKNVKVIQSKIEDFLFDKKINTIVTRATYSISDMIEKVKHLQVPETNLLMMKGKYPVDELKEISKGYTYEIRKLQVPYLEKERHLVELRMTN